MRGKREKEQVSEVQAGVAGEAAAPLRGVAPAERIEVVVPADGLVPVPRLLVRLLDLVPGDMMQVEPKPEGLELRPHRELMRQWRDRPAQELLQSLDTLYPPQGGWIGPAGLLALMPAVFPVRAGQTLVWEAEDLGSRLRLSLRPKGPAGSAPEPGEAPGQQTARPAGAGAAAPRPRPGPSRQRPRRPGGGQP